MRKTLYTLNVGNKYSPEICAMTYPLMRKYADKCGAEFFIIDDDKFPGWPLTVNKFQIYDLSRERGDRWSLFMDSDTIVHPDMPDITELIPMDTVFHHNSDFAACRWRPDDFFRRDGRQISSASWIMIASSWCRDFWTPPTEQVTDDGLGFMTKEEIVHRILLNAKELDYGLPPEHLIDDYTFSRNIARFGLKFTTIHQISEKWKLPFRGLWHKYLIPDEVKVGMIRETLHWWAVDGSGDCGRQGCPRCHPQDVPGQLQPLGGGK
jgi:hypothetical protein